MSNVRFKKCTLNKQLTFHNKGYIQVQLKQTDTVVVVISQWDYLLLLMKGNQL